MELEKMNFEDVLELFKEWIERLDAENPKRFNDDFCEAWGVGETSPIALMFAAFIGGLDTLERIKGKAS